LIIEFIWLTLSQYQKESKQRIFHEKYHQYLSRNCFSDCRFKVAWPYIKSYRLFFLAGFYTALGSS